VRIPVAALHRVPAEYSRAAGARIVFQVAVVKSDLDFPAGVKLIDEIGPIQTHFDTCAAPLGLKSDPCGLAPCIRFEVDERTGLKRSDGGRRRRRRGCYGVSATAGSEEKKGQESDACGPICQPDDS